MAVKAPVLAISLTFPVCARPNEQFSRCYFACPRKICAIRANFGGFRHGRQRLAIPARSAATDVGVITTIPDEAWECERKTKLFIVREAKLDVELWAAAWLRADSYCEDQPYIRYVESYKKKFAEQEFDALKRRLSGKYGHSIKCVCYVAAIIDGQCNAGKATVLESVVGTLDLSVRCLSAGEAFPGERPRKYGYISNVCVSKTTRRCGIASTVLPKAIETAKEWGLKELYVHVDPNNRAAICLYSKHGFQVLQAEVDRKLGQQKVLLLCLPQL